MTVNASGASIVGGSAVNANASFTPPAASIAAGNIIGTAQQFTFAFADGTPMPPGQLIRLLSVSVRVDAAALISGEGAYTLHTYNVTPPSARATNTAWTRASGDLTAYRGSIVLGTPAFAGTGYIKTQLTDLQDFSLSSSSLWGELINAGTFTGVAVARQVFLHGVAL